MPLLKDVRADNGHRVPCRDAAGYAIPLMRLVVVSTMPGSVPLGGRSRRGACGPDVLLGVRPARCVPVALCARCVFPFGARRQCTASDGSRISMDAASRSIVAWSTPSEVGPSRSSSVEPER